MDELNEIAGQLSGAERQIRESSQQTSENTRALRTLNDRLIEAYRQNLVVLGKAYTAEQVCKLSGDVQMGLLEKRKLLAVAMSVSGLEKSVCDEEIARLVDIGEPAYVLLHQESIKGSLYGLAVFLNNIEEIAGPCSLLRKVQIMWKSIDEGKAAGFVQDVVFFAFDFFREKQAFQSRSEQLSAAYSNASISLKGLFYVLEPTNFSRYFAEF